MTAPDFDDLLHAYGKQSVPVCPDRLTPEIWDEISKRRRRSWATRLLLAIDWREPLREPVLLASALAAAVAVGTIPAILAGTTGRNSSLVRESLHLEVFTAASSVAGVYVPSADFTSR